MPLSGCSLHIISNLDNRSCCSTPLSGCSLDVIPEFNNRGLLHLIPEFVDCNCPNESDERCCCSGTGTHQSEVNPVRSIVLPFHLLSARAVISIGNCFPPFIGTCAVTWMVSVLLDVIHRFNNWLTSVSQSQSPAKEISHTVHVNNNDTHLHACPIPSSELRLQLMLWQLRVCRMHLPFEATNALCVFAGFDKRY